ncbi:MAG: ATP-binding protein [Sideroxydans sp.]|nr:ATP-binding protein [Sideroxydans sp.]
MGRLFWKFFIVFWLAQVTTFIGVGVAMWSHSSGMEQFRAPPPTPSVAAAASLLRHSGRAALQDFLLEQSREPTPPIYALDESHHDILDRPVPAWMLEQAPQIAGAQNSHGMAEKVSAADGHTYLLFAPPPDSRNMPRPLDRGMLPPLMPLLSGLVVSLIFAALLAWYFSTPIRKLRSAFEALANGHLEARLVPVMGKRRDELADLGRDFDSMAQRLQQLMDGQRKVLHDVSHELRSPLARLQAAIGLARQQPERIEDSMARIERESVRMDALVSELLTLSRLEAGMTGKLDESVDLNELISNVVEDARFETEANGCRIAFEKSSQTVVRGNAELLHRALENVVRNAVKHSPSEGLVTIKLQNNDNQTIGITVSDEGSGVPEADMLSIFEPFFRSDQTKTSDGHGLGLAIAQRVITAHQGKIFASNRPFGGLCLTITLPLGPAT